MVHIPAPYGSEIWEASQAIYVKAKRMKRGRWRITIGTSF